MHSDHDENPKSLVSHRVGEKSRFRGLVNNAEGFFHMLIHRLKEDPLLRSNFWNLVLLFLNLCQR